MSLDCLTAPVEECETNNRRRRLTASARDLHWNGAIGDLPPLSITRPGGSFADRHFEV